MQGSDSDALNGRHIEAVAKAIIEGRCVFFIGAGANQCFGPDEEVDKKNQLPMGRDLIQKLCELSKDKALSSFKRESDLLATAQYLATVDNRAWLHDTLNTIMARNEIPIPAIHRLIASLPVKLSKLPSSMRPKTPYPLVVTTNYDTLLERAFDEASEASGKCKFDLIYLHHDCGTEKRTMEFRHCCKPHGTPKTLPGNNKKSAGVIDLEERPVILKLHGTVESNQESIRIQGSFVITRDDYLQYVNSPLLNQIPPEILGEIKKRIVFFVGYGLNDWNLRLLFMKLLNSSPGKAYCVEKPTPDGGPLDLQRFNLENAMSLSSSNMSTFFIVANLSDVLPRLHRAIDELIDQKIAS